ncbi:recombinase [Komagataeibacter rhaeticus]|uniref:recombinase n=1 Tax=Komagataeibacter rhaeticus TaxID=215221 RepID=UPI001F0B3BE2|nr:recombinase [Komagataeibacter rhaeticus]
MPSSGAYSARFGSLLRAYHLVGFRPDRDYRYITINRQLRRLHPEIIRQIITELRTNGGDVWQAPQDDRIIVNDEFSLSVTIARCVETPTGLLRWKMHFDTSLIPDITVVVRMNATNRTPLDYYLFPRIDMMSGKLRLSEDNGLALDAYRFDNLELLYDIVTPISIAEVA